MHEFYYQSIQQSKEHLKFPMKVIRKIVGKQQVPFVHFIEDNYIVLTFNGETSCISLENFSVIWNIPKVGWVSSSKDKIFFTKSVQDKVEVFDLISGKLIERLVSETLLGNYVIDNQFVIDVGGDQDGLFLYIDKYSLNKSLEKLWRFQIEDESSSRFLLSEGKLVLNGNYGFYCLDWETGKLVWELSLEDIWSNVYEHLVWKDLVIILMGLKTKAFDIHTGTLRWEQQVKGFLQGTIYGDKLYLIDNQYYGVLDVTTGEIIVEKDISHIYNSFGVAAESVLQYGVAITETQAVFATSIGVLFVLDKWTGEVLWHYQGNGIINVKPLVYNQRIYIVEHYNEQTSVIILEEA